MHLEWWREAVKDASPSVALAGELGAGKTWAIMTMLFHLVDIGGQFLSIDRTDQGEYAGPASTLPSHTIVDLMRPAWSLDPLRISPPIWAWTKPSTCSPCSGAPPTPPWD